MRALIVFGIVVEGFSLMLAFKCAFKGEMQYATFFLCFSIFAATNQKYWRDRIKEEESK